MQGIKSSYGIFCKDEKHYLQESAAIIYKDENVVFAGNYEDAVK